MPFEGIPCNLFCLHHEQAYVVALSWVKRVHLVSLPATLWMVNDLKYMVVVVHGCPCNINYAPLYVLLKGIASTV